MTRYAVGIYDIALEISDPMGHDFSLSYHCLVLLCSLLYWYFSLTGSYYLVIFIDYLPVIIIYCFSLFWDVRFVLFSGL